MQLSIIIVNYNVRPFLENCLSSLRKAMEGITAEIFVVDNASDDGSAGTVRSKFPEVRVVVNAKNIGFAAANNIALRQAQGTYVLLINPDTIVQEDTLRTMRDFFDHHPDAGLAGCKILNPDGSLQPACRRSFPTPWVAFTKISGLSALFPRTSLFGRYNLTYRSPDETYEVDAVSGSFMFVRREVYEKIGGLDEQFFMYGEDLDWCYRMQQAGWKIYYVHTTKIIHYKGESAKRSDIDELRLFYEAMHLFVKKHFNKPSLAHFILRTAIVFRSWLAVFAKALRPLPMILTDWLVVAASLVAAEFLRFGEFFRLPAHAYPVLFIVPPVIVVSSMYSLGLYTRHRLAIRRAAAAAVVGFVLISALTFFFKDYAFSRVVVAYSGIICIALLPAWRLIARGRSPGSRRSLFGRRTLIVGTERSAHEVLRRLRARLDNGYSVVGFIDMTKQRIGEKIGGVEILGSIDNIGKVIRERKVTEVIFSTDTLSYMDILSVIGKSRERTVNFRLVPSSLEVIIGKTSIDQLDDIPLVDIDYNLDRTMNRLLKRLFDLSVGLLLLPLYVLHRLRAGRTVPRPGVFTPMVPEIIKGQYSLVGPPIVAGNASALSRNGTAAYLGKPGVTGLAQINADEELTPEEIEKYNLYYARNQSFVLDVEILVKSVLQMLKKR